MRSDMNSLQQLSKNPMEASNRQAIMSKTSTPLPNVLGRVVKWEADGAAKVEVLADAPGVRQGEIYFAKTRFDTFNVKPTNFATLKKFGLRIGGIVLLRRAEVVEDGTL